MATLSSGAFLPTGGFERDFSTSINRSRFGNSPSIPSPPSSLPRSRSHYNRVGSLQQASQPRRPEDASPLSLASLRDACASQPTVVPPHLQFDTIPSNPRAASLSPNRTPRTSDWNPPPLQNKALSRIAPGVDAASLSRSVSADAVGTSQTALHIVQRLTQQNALIREAWEAERNYLEVNRRRAEEVYQEERAIMEDVKMSWEDEKSEMLKEIKNLTERVHRLEGENSTLKALAAQSIQANGVVSPLASQRGGSASTDNSSFSVPLSRVTSKSQNPLLSQSFSMAVLPPGLDGASRRPHFISSGSSRVSPTSQPDHSSPFVPLDPRTQPETSTSKDFLASPDDSETPVPVIDVQEIDPKLEGIPIKATAVQKPTFALSGSPPSETSPKSSRATSPNNDSSLTDQSRPRALPKEHTLQVLVAPESRRLTMHAGHTPSHSLSLFASGNPTETSTIVGQSEGATPTAEATAPPPRHPENSEETQNVDTKGKGKAVERSYHFEYRRLPDHPTLDDPEAMFEPRDDHPMKGPLMIRNMPAQDEIFWEAVNKKLEPISKGKNALPAVIQATLRTSESSGAGPSGTDAHPRVGIVGGDASDDNHAAVGVDEEDPEALSSGTKSVEPDVPLKLRSTSNFGAPFGVM